ncbi:MAG: glycerophosphodiester phosphodiesterase [Methylococcaceae bacterium]|jgi:glycerophosphoryl diester phosphodiesterase|nr:glycerophosphodiester phosphodiesterase [Methylococcaceae bacterium]MDP2395049.1 glycerophosphodiester phosphodiesterase [Methylococcaceae bacterium]MDP3020549.1 glycerophosphodiester phosphodiesterase [Methylococcaceae bacterium]MDP3389740.1 glycerophosphodiester phosphodiesterase [Methylococcaceae bacterium]MDP3931071.1 glycerophosphodiester phosphodiesterase [Methylococcaceae bacterium]
MNPKNNLIFAHRGGNKEAVEQGLGIAENTRAAFNHALLSAVDGVETDVQLSRDEVPVLWHDWFLDKLGHPGKRIDDFTFEQLKDMDFAGYGETGATPEAVLSLEEFIASYQGLCQLNIEIKSHDDESATRQQRKLAQTLAIIEPFGNQGVFISSYSLPCLEFAHQQAADFPLFYLLSDCYSQTDIEQLLETHAFLKGFCLPICNLDSAIVDLLHKNGKVLAAYTCNNNEEITKAIAVKADIVITDYPLLALSLRS